MAARRDVGAIRQISYTAAQLIQGWKIVKNLKFHRIRAKNILCFGSDGIDLRFSEYGNIVQVVGVNLDTPGSVNGPASNGSGKSTLQEILSIGLFGKMVKHPTKNKAGEMLNVLASDGEVEVEWDDYKIIRTFHRKKTGGITTKIKLWKSVDHIWDNVTLIDHLNDGIEKELARSIGLSHHAFCNVVIFDDSNRYSFLEADTPKKRSIVENLLDLDQYCGYNQNAKDALKDIKRQILDVSKEYSWAVDLVSSCERHISSLQQQEKQWVSIRNKEVVDLERQTAEKQKLLEVCVKGSELLEWQRCQDKIVSLSDEIIDLESKISKVREILVTVRSKMESARNDKDASHSVLHQHQIALKEAEANLRKTGKLLEDLKGLKENTPCPVCFGTILRSNYGHVISQSVAESDKHRSCVEKETRAITAGAATVASKTELISLLEEKVKMADDKIKVLEQKIRLNQENIKRCKLVPKPDTDLVVQQLGSEITALKSQIQLKKTELAGESPYHKVISDSLAEKLEKTEKRDATALAMRNLEAEIPYLEYWIEAFGDNGIRKYVVDGIIPALNSRIAHWLECLIDGVIDVQFNNMFEETIVRNGNPVNYSGISNGECRRINLATSQSFAHIMMLDSGNCPSLVFLDEITGGGIDRAGVVGVYNMIQELAKERQVFVTTHNESLMALLQGCDTIVLKKQNDITSLVP